MARIFSGSLNSTFQLPHVEANGLRLVSEFNVPGEIAYNKMNLFGSAEANSTDSYLLKEYFLFVVSNLVVVSFVPSNGRLVLLMLLRVAEVGSGVFDVSVRGVGGGRGGLELGKQGIETLYRLNVGGSSIRPSHDSLLWRA
ncbi:probable receptor-like protein kinase At1g30570 [Salvia splendens]|uniref:probable receptor-like protein kinase At1g30570 n=1 Tax=Salvia splendens TaxID=180675 RepID=UPI001C26F5A1|nr:probable receptor-like protein kinase At1g30570 [Salvia splendens]